MNRSVFRRSPLVGGAVLKAALVGALLALVAAPSLAQTVADKYQRQRDQQLRESRFSLFAEPVLVLDVNQYQCGLRNQGDTCSDIFNSPTGGGGFWPTGSANQYMFNGGLNMAGIIPPDAGFAWAGDTTGAYFMDARGTQQQGEGITNIYNSLNADDVANWPDVGSIPDFPELTAYVVDEDLYNPVLLGRAAASQQDSWVAFWDGNPAFSANRSHPMGILVEQRSLAWNFPAGNEATIYFIYNFRNITDNALFQRLNEVQYFGGENALPDDGWTIDSIYVSADFDPDVTTDFDKNYSTAILPFNMGVAYEGEFVATDFTYFPDLFFPPFFTNAPGLVAAKYLRSPIDPNTNEEVGLTLFTVHENPSSPGAQFPDPFGVQNLWRVLSGNISAGLGDAPCTFPNPKERRVCFLAQEPKDTRFLQASGPFSLGPGESQTVVVAQFPAATVETPLIIPGNTNANAPGIPSLRPGCGGLGEEIRPIEVGAGWVATANEACTETTGVIDQFKVEVVPLSLLGRALVAQTIFDNKFLLGFAPEAPNFYLVAGDRQVTVVWEESPTEETGDPFFSAAGDPANALYNPNYREFDVEGYRVYRGTDPSNLRLVAQFDKADTEFVDNICETDPTYVTGDPCTSVDEVDIVSPFIQYPLGGVVRLEDGSTLVTASDEIEGLTNSGIPFAYVDNTVRNGFQYFYRVTAFDVNSLRSGPSSLESSGSTKSIFPQAPSSDLTTAQFNASLIDKDGNALEPGDPPTVDPATGTFNRPQLPTDQLFGDFLAFAPQLLPTGTFEVRIDSIVGGYYAGEYYVSLSGPGVPAQSYVFAPDDMPCETASGCEYEVPPITVPSNPEVRQQLINAGVEAPPASGQLTSVLKARLTQWRSGDSDWAYTVPGFWSVDPPSPDALDGGSRWFSGDNETMADPTLELAHGELDGVDVIFQPVPFQGVLADPGVCGAVPDHMRRMFQTTWVGSRAADMKIYWGAAGVDSIIDVTHNVAVPYSDATRGSYGFRTDSDGNGVIDFVDFWYTPGLENTPNIGCAAAGNPQPLAQQPVLGQVDSDGDRVADGSGFALYIAGEPYIFQTSAIPSNTVWTLRTYSGIVTKASGSYTFQETPRTAGVTGLRYALTVDAAATIAPETADLAKVHTVPDPYYATSQFDLGPATKNLRFVNLPSRCTIRIYSVSGVLVDVINHDDVAGGGQATWDMRNRSGQFVASGVYFFHVVTTEGTEHIGKFTIVNFAN